MKLNIILLVIAHILTEAGEVIEKWPSMKYAKVTPFINYKWPHDPDGLYLTWWVKYNTDTLLLVTIFFVCMRVFARYSLRLWLCSLMLLCYHLIDLFLLWYNYRTGHATYWAVAITMIGCLLSLLAKDKKLTEGGKVISIE